MKTCLVNGLVQTFARKEIPNLSLEEAMEAKQEADYMEELRGGPHIAVIHSWDWERSDQSTGTLSIYMDYYSPESLHHVIQTVSGHRYGTPRSKVN